MRDGNIGSLDRASGGSNNTIQMNPSFASLGSLRNVDESSGSDEDDLVTAAAEEGIFAVPGGRPAGPSSNSVRLFCSFLICLHLHSLTYLKIHWTHHRTIIFCSPNYWMYA